MKTRLFSITLILLLALGLFAAPAAAGGKGGGGDTVTAAGGPSPDTVGGPDAFGYTFADNLEPNCNPTLVDISTTGTGLGLSDDGEANISTPFTFNFYGVASSDFRVGNNGAVMFNATSGDIGYTNAALPNASLPLTLMAYWDDIYQTTGNVYWQVLGTAPNRTLVVEWYQRDHISGSPTDPGTFEMILYEGTNNIEFIYPDTTFGNASVNNGASATVGINQSATNALQYEFNTPGSVPDGRAICFYPPAPAPRLDFSTKTAPANAYTGVPFDYTIDLVNIGTLPSTATTLVDPIPTGVTYVAGSVTGGATYNSALNQIEWSGVVPAQSTVEITFQVTASVLSGTITNSATINDPGIPDPVVVTADTAITAAPTITVNPTSLASAQATNVQRTLPLTIGNTGYAPLDWTIGEELPLRPTSPMAYGVEYYGANLVSLDLAAATTLNTIGPIGNTDLYSGDFLGGDFTKLYALDSEASQFVTIDTTTAAKTIIGTSVSPDSDGWTGLTADPTTQTLYASSTVCGSTSTLSTINPATGAVTVVGTIASGTCIIDIAANGAGELYAVDLIADTLLHVDKTTGTGTVIGSIGFNANYAQGMDFDETTNTLYLAAYNGSTSQSELRTADLNTGATTFVSLLGAGSGVEMDAFAIATGGQSCGGDDLPWASVSPISGTTPVGGNTQVNVTFDSTGLADGTYTGSLGISSNDPANRCVHVPLTLTVRAPTAVSVSSMAAEGSSALPFALAALFTIVVTGAVVVLRKR